MAAYQTPQEWLTQLESQPPQPSLMNMLTRYGLAANEQAARYILFGTSGIHTPKYEHLLNKSCFPHHTLHVV
jgi:hypothetical protein